MSSEGSPRPPGRRIRRVVLMSSASSSDSDESVGAARSRKKRLRVVSESEGAESSGSSVRAAGARRRRLPQLRDSELESESSGSDSDPSPRTAPPAAATAASGFASDSSEGNSDKCSICLLRFTDQQVGTPQACEHIFCLDCITEWSKNVNTCPVDRITFESIVVRSCIGGRVLRTEPVKVVERRSSVDMLVVEDPTICEICGSSDSEETMLLCDGCDLGYHMACLTPPLDQIPIDQWFCPDCAGDAAGDNVIYLSEVNDLLMDIEDIQRPLPARAHPLRQPRNVRRSARTQEANDQPTTSSGRRSQSQLNSEAPSTSRSTAPRRKTTTRRRKYKRRRTRTVLIEYEVQGDGKFPITKKVKRKIRKRKIRKPRTAARRSLVRASVRARLADLRTAADATDTIGASQGVQSLFVARRRAGVPSLSLFGTHDQLEYFEDEDGSETAATAGTAVASRPTAAVLSAYRQARRKMISIPSPPHASSAPDILSSILDSQSRLHSPHSVVSLTVDGQVDIKLQTNLIRKDSKKKDDKVDVTKGEDTSKKAPSYPGQRGGWGGGYRGNYHREQGSTFNRSGNYENSFRGGNFQNRQQGNGGAWRDEQNDNNYEHFPRRQHHYDEPQDRNRRQDNNRGGYNQRDQGRHSYNDNSHHAPPPARHSFGGFDNPVDMRLGNSSLAHNDAPRRQTLPEPPVFKFKSTVDEDDKSDPESLVIDTEKYDPMEPTHDEDEDEGQGEGSGALPSPPRAPLLAPPSPPQVPATPLQAPPPVPTTLLPIPPLPNPPPNLQKILSGIDTNTINVPSNVLDNAVRQVLKEHRNLIVPPSGSKSDEDSDGDCPNFSIYSATSVHIANTSNQHPDNTHPQEPVVHTVRNESPIPEPEDSPVRQSEEELQQEKYKQTISKRCPITPSARNPIKIKLNTPQSIKRLNLYDDEDSVPDDASKPVDKDQPTDKNRDKTTRDRSKTPERRTSKSSISPDKSSSVADSKSKSPKRSVNSPDKKQSNNNEQSDHSPLYDEPVHNDVLDNNSNKENDEDDKNANNVNDKEESDVDKSPKSDATPDMPQAEEADQLDGDQAVSDSELDLNSQTSKQDGDKQPEKMTESISETEDERSYTPCLDENKSTREDNSFEEKEAAGIEGLDTEMISEDEGNEMFSDTEKEKEWSPKPQADKEDGEILDKLRAASPALSDDGKKKKKKYTKKESKETKSKGKKKNDVAFKKVSKTSKERNYRDKEDKKRRERDGSDSERSRSRERRKEKRKDLERYDVRNLVTAKRRRVKDAFGRDVSPSRSPSAPPPRSPPPAPRRSPHKRRKSISPRRKSISPRRKSISPRRKSISPRRKSISPRRKSISPRRKSVSPRRRSITPRRRSGSPRRRSISPRRRSVSPRRRSASRGRKRSRSVSARRRPAPPAPRSRSPRNKTKKKKRPRSASRDKRRRARRDKSPKHKKKKKSFSPELELSPAWGRAWSPSPPRAGTPPRLDPPPPRTDETKRKKKEKKRLREEERRRAAAAPAPSKEIFTSGNNILVSVSFADQEPAAKRKRRGARKEKRRAAAAAPEPAAKPVAIIDLERSPFRELTPSPKNVIVLSDSEHSQAGAEPPAPAPAAPAAPPAPAPPAAPLAGPKTPPEPLKFSIPKPAPAPRAPNPLAEPEAEEARGPSTPPSPGSPPASPASSRDAYDPFEPTRSPSPAPAAPAPAAAPAMTLEAAQKTNMSADDVLDQRPLTPGEKVMALLQSTRAVSPDAPPPAAPEDRPPTPPPAAAEPARPTLTVASTQRIVLPSPKNSPLKSQPPKLFLTKPSPIKSTPIKPLQSTKISKLPLPTVKPVQGRKARADLDVELGGDSPYSPGSSDFGDLFEPPRGKADVFDSLFGAAKKKKSSKGASKPTKKKSKKTQVGVKIDDDNLKVLDELPNSAVEMQVKSKFLKKLNRQERVVEEVKLVLKPHYNKKHVTKDEYKDVLRRAVPKICHNKSGEINPTKIQSLVEAYVKKIRKKHKLGLA
ncbi:hypothetical protein JYU34_017381 [Plutella xylostella]|uniref:PHD and RING finger domain-containing protein 1 n=1 Tax=Plutella xylostella TaxID=51655 RepID=A0ABQ7Q1U4_PLUXY|nr:hypothetical protein JYU34_017381 [Plutella xylostella]